MKCSHLIPGEREHGKVCYILTEYSCMEQDSNIKIQFLLFLYILYTQPFSVLAFILQPVT